jgi:nucleotide-binding universal stress UspA family protein
MFTQIVVPLDGSAFAEAALAPACELARAFGSRLVVVRAVVPGGVPRTLAPSATPTELQSLDEADAYLVDVVSRLRAAGFDASMALCIAEPGTAIARVAEVGPADLIVMTAHPRWKADLLDNTSTTLQVLARSRVPILAWRTSGAGGAARETTRSASEQRTTIVNADSPILVPLDGSPFAEAALPMAEQLARQLGSYLVCMRAVGSEQGHGGAEEEARAYLKGVEQDLKLRGVGVTTEVLRGGPVAAIDPAVRDHAATV